MQKVCVLSHAIDFVRMQKPVFPRIAETGKDSIPDESKRLWNVLVRVQRYQELSRRDNTRKMGKSGNLK